MREWGRKRTQLPQRFLLKPPAHADDRFPFLFRSLYRTGTAHSADADANPDRTCAASSVSQRGGTANTQRPPAAVCRPKRSEAKHPRPLSLTPPSNIDNLCRFNTQTTQPKTPQTLQRHAEDIAFGHQSSPRSPRHTNSSSIADELRRATRPQLQLSIPYRSDSSQVVPVGTQRAFPPTPAPCSNLPYCTSHMAPASPIWLVRGMPEVASLVCQRHFYRNFSQHHRLRPSLTEPQTFRIFIRAVRPAAASELPAAAFS